MTPEDSRQRMKPQMAPQKSGFKLSRRGFLAGVAGTSALKFLPKIASQTGGRRILTLYYDKALGMMRAVDRLVP